MGEEQLKECPLCERELIDGPSTDKHHLIPRSEGGKNTIPEKIHVVCHRKIHATFSESELGNYYFTWERLKENEHIKRFVDWVKKKDPQFIDVHKYTRDRKNCK